MKIDLKYYEIFHLIDEFNKLGFEFRKFDLDEAVIIRNGFYVRSRFEIKIPVTSATTFAVMFVISTSDEKKPSIEELRAAFLDEVSRNQFVTLAVINYSVQEKPLPNNEQIFSDLSETLRYKKAAERSISKTQTKDGEYKKILKPRNKL